MKHQQALVLSLAVLILGFGFAAPAEGATLYKFQAGVWNGTVADTGYATDDAYVEPNGTTSGVSNSNLNFNTDRIRLKSTSGGDPILGVMGFNIAATSGITVTSATLTLTVQYGGGVTLSNIELYNLPTGNTTWTETTATSSYQNGTVGTTKWKTSTGADSSQFQYALTDATLLDSTGTVGFTVGQQVTFNISAAVAQAWVDTPSSFTGLALKMTAGSDQVILYSGEEATTSNRPLLTITAVPEPSSFALVGVGVVVLLTARRRRI